MQISCLRKWKSFTNVYSPSSLLLLKHSKAIEEHPQKMKRATASFLFLLFLPFWTSPHAGMWDSEGESGKQHHQAINKYPQITINRFLYISPLSPAQQRSNLALWLTVFSASSLPFLLRRREWKAGNWATKKRETLLSDRFSL